MSPDDPTSEKEVDRNPLNRKSLSPGLWLLKHTQSIVTTITTLAVLKLRNSQIIYYVFGSLTTSFTAKGLKLIIKQPRPPGSVVVKTHGMPSTHSSTISFMGVYLTLTSIFLPFHETIKPSPDFEYPLRVALGVLGVTMPLLVMWSRVKLGLHTPEQTYAGAAIGISMALAFWTTWNGLDSFSLDGNRSWDVGLGLVRNGIGRSFGRHLDERFDGIEKIVRKKLEL